MGYSLSKQLTKKYLYRLVIYSFFIPLFIIVLMENNRGWLNGPDVLLMSVLIYYISQIFFFTKSIYEPAIKIFNGRIEINDFYNSLETGIENLSHAEVRSERHDMFTGDYKYEFVFFKKPVARYIKFFGIKFWKTSTQGFRLDIVDETAGKEIKEFISHVKIDKDPKWK